MDILSAVACPFFEWEIYVIVTAFDILMGPGCLWSRDLKLDQPWLIHVDSLSDRVAGN